MTITTNRCSSRTHRGRRTILGSAAALAVGAGLTLTGGLAAGAQAAGPTRTPIDTTDDPTVSTVTDLCPFPVTISSVQVGTLTDFTDASGAGDLIFTGSETDTFIGPSGDQAHTLVGKTFHGSVHATVDAQGDVTRLFGAGESEVIPLHNGSTFFAAGRINFLNHPPDQVVVVVPDVGTSRNLDELCRELAPGS